MDTGEGTFKRVKDEDDLDRLQREFPNHGDLFQLGETLTIRGSRFKVRKITKKDIVLRLLPRLPKEE